ncbi:MAG TPA: arsinothricin resistance N-acetyltransferase ArsN1 family B [Caulobacteraceae bacterium]
MTIRAATPADAGAVRAIYEPNITEAIVSFEEEVPPVEVMAARIKATLPAYPWLVWEEDGGVRGYAYASRHHERAAYRWSVDAAVYVAAGMRGQGIARALYTRLFELLERQGFHAAFAGISLPNPASVRLHESFGFEPVGVYREVGWKHGAWRDVGCWRKPLAPAAPGKPAEPIPFAQLASAPAA